MFRGSSKSSLAYLSGLVGCETGAMALGFVLEETEADFLRVVTEEEMELDLEFDLEVLLRWGGGGIFAFILTVAQHEGADTNVNQDVACRC